MWFRITIKFKDLFESRALVQHLEIENFINKVSMEKSQHTCVLQQLQKHATNRISHKYRQKRRQEKTPTYLHIHEAACQTTVKNLPTCN